MLNFSLFLKLTEAKIDDLMNREYQVPIKTSHDPEAKFTQTNDIINHFHQANPTKDINHTQWLVNQYRKKNIKQEDAPAMTQMLTDFNKHRDKLQRKNINQYKNTSELLDALRPHTEKKSKTDIQKEKSSEAIRNGSTLIHDNSDVSLYHVHDKEAAKELGRGLPWCTSNRDDKKNRFDHYNEKTGRRFFIAHMKNEEAPFRRIGIGNGVGEFQDENNKKISDTTLKSLIKRNPSLTKIPQLYGTRILLTPESEHTNYVNDLLDNKEKPGKINLEKGNLPKEKITQILSKDKWSNLPKELIQNLVNHPNWDNFEHNKILADKEHYGSWENNDIAIGNNPKHFDKRTIDMLVNHPYTGILSHVAKRPELTQDHVNKLFKQGSDDPGIFKNLMDKNRLSKDQLQQVSAMDNWASEEAKKRLSVIKEYNILGFSQYLKEEKAGDITARQGHANEFFTDMHSNKYAQAIQEAKELSKNEYGKLHEVLLGGLVHHYAQTYQKAKSSGMSHEDAHQAAMSEISNLKHVDGSHLYQIQHMPQFKDVNNLTAEQLHNDIGKRASPEEYQDRYEHALHGATALINHLHSKGITDIKGVHFTANANDINRLPGYEKIKDPKNNADIVVEHGHAGRYYGVSLKAGSESKLNNPGMGPVSKLIDQYYEKITGKKSRFGADASAAEQAAKQAHTEILNKHADFLRKHFGSDGITVPNGMKETGGKILILKPKKGSDKTARAFRYLEKAQDAKDDPDLQKLYKSEQDRQKFEDIYSELRDSRTETAKRATNASMGAHMKEIFDQQKDPSKKELIREFMKKFANIGREKGQMPLVRLNTAKNSAAAVKKGAPERVSTVSDAEADFDRGFEKSYGHYKIQSNPGTINTTLSSPAGHNMSFVVDSSPADGGSMVNRAGVHVWDKSEHGGEEHEEAPVHHEPAPAVQYKEEPIAQHHPIGKKLLSAFRKPKSAAQRRAPQTDSFVLSRPNPGVMGSVKPAKEKIGGSWNDFHPND